ncbi:hypothetical protein R3P38DRAFT_2813536 [Favolaschia claudopus]|uniref:Uncharacterized protein n=1 Tax=Favolaschia claudopus TaxID=2862362 RepID=A0AAV9Z736_9AGAR
MHCNFFLTFVVSFLAIAVSAAPISVPDANSIDSREIPHAPFVGISDVARAVEPESDARNTDSETAAEITEEARGCRMYACIWYVVFYFLCPLISTLTLIMVVPTHTLTYGICPGAHPLRPPSLAVVPLRHTTRLNQQPFSENSTYYLPTYPAAQDGYLLLLTLELYR